MSDIFDIRDYDFEYMNPCSVDKDGDLHFECGSRDEYLSRTDTIALAKHFKITQDEIEGFQ